VATKQDARGVITTYGYDTLHRLIQVTYNTVSGVTTAPAVSYNYDNTVGSATSGLLLSLSVGSGYSETYSYNVGYGNGGNGGNKVTLASVTRVMDGRSYLTSYQSNAANQLTSLTYPSSRVISLGHDSKGRATSVGSFLSSVTYNGIGQLTGTTLSNGVTESFGYDANRMQLTSQTATQSGGPANGLMNLTYGYQASAGQMGAGTTAGNAGQLMSIGGTIGGVTESAAYTYDDLGRLVTSNQISNASTAQRRFAYDRWGNRTGMWDATSGGNQIQSITLQQSGGAPTNRMTSVTSGSTVNYSYDAAGNVTNDGVHSYGYDSENRIVSVDGGSTTSYAYDNQNRRYKKTISATLTHYVWQGSQVLSEHNGSTGAVLIDYAYSGSRMIAKVASGSTQYFLSDRLSVRLSLDSSGNVAGRQGHLPFGEDFGENGSQEKHHFTSYERDGESALDYAINRGYSGTVGRFHSADPYDSSSYLLDPQSWNRYSYAQNDSVNFADPMGLFRRRPPAATAPSGDLPGTDTGRGAVDNPSEHPEPHGGGGPDQYSDLNPCEKELFWESDPIELGFLRQSRNRGERAGLGYPGQRNGPGDAVRHCTWNCEMTRTIGKRNAEAWANAHECKEDGKIDYGYDETKMDLHNNEVGRALGSDWKDNRECSERCGDALAQGKLTVLPKDRWMD